MAVQATNVIRRVSRSMVVVTAIAFIWTVSPIAVYSQDTHGGTPEAPAATPPSPPPAAGQNALPDSVGSGTEAHATPQAGTPGGTASPAASPAASPDATASAKRAAEAACKKAIDLLGKGDLAAWKSLPPDKRKEIESYNGMPGGLPEVFTCLALATKDSGYCGLLSAEEKSECTGKMTAMAKLKALPKGASLMQVMMPTFDKQCRAKHAKGECDNLQDALLKRDESKCEHAPAEYKDGCAAFISGDASRCPKDDFECQNLTRADVKFREGGLASMDEPSAKAAVSGKRQDCEPLLTALERGCK